jgi:hypothetical protein
MNERQNRPNEPQGEDDARRQQQPTSQPRQEPRRNPQDDRPLQDSGQLEPGESNQRAVRNPNPEESDENRR